jgi:hypothetical protein
MEGLFVNLSCDASGGDLQSGDVHDDCDDRPPIVDTWVDDGQQKSADHDEWTAPATIDDPAILDEIRAALVAAGVGAIGGAKG